MSPLTRYALAALAVLGVSSPGSATESTVSIALSFSGDAERKLVRYECEGLQPFAVEYLNAAPNFLALMPVGEEIVVMTTVMAASGAKYVAGNFVWWTKGAEAEFYDLTLGDDAPPTATCLEAVETP